MSNSDFRTMNRRAAEVLRNKKVKLDDFVEAGFTPKEAARLFAASRKSKHSFRDELTSLHHESRTQNLIDEEILIEDSVPEPPAPEPLPPAADVILPEEIIVVEEDGPQVGNVNPGRPARHSEVQDLRKEIKELKDLIKEKLG